MEEIRMPAEELARALRRMAAETGSLPCLGCGHEHSCGVHGCAILKAAVEKLERERWIPAEERLPEKDGVYLCRYTFAQRDGTLSNLRSIGCIRYYAHEDYHWQHAYLRLRVTHWRELPELPEGDHYETL